MICLVIGYLVIGGVAKNFLPLLLKLKRKGKQLEMFVKNYTVTTNEMPC